MLADALLRQARVSGDAGLAVEAEHALSAVLKQEPLEYEARRMLATVYLSEHRFGEAVREGERLRTQSPLDPWNYGVIGDGRLELGDYEDAFAAFQQMLDFVRVRPRTRASDAYELRGQLSAALDAMRMAADVTSPRDPESLAWHHAQIGSLLFQMGRAKEAEGEYARALAFWPGHPAAVIGLGRLKAFAGDYAGAVALYDEEFRHAPTPDLSAQIGDLYAALGNRAGAERHYAIAEAGWRSDAPEPKNLARFLAERGRSLDQAVTIAEQAARERHDIFTEDASVPGRIFVPAGWQKRRCFAPVAAHRHVRSHAPVSRGVHPARARGRRRSAQTRRPVARREPPFRSRERTRRPCLA